MEIQSGFNVAMLSVVTLVSMGFGPQSKTFKDTVKFEQGGSLTLHVGPGSVNLRSCDENEIRINALIKSPKGVDAEYARGIVEAARVGVKRGLRSLTIQSIYDDVPYRKDGEDSGARIIPHIHYRIQAPRNLNLHLNTSRSRIDVSGFEGETTVKAQRGDQNIRNLRGRIRVQVSRGNLTANELNGSINIRGNRSSISAKALAGVTDLNLSRGKADLSEMRGTLTATSNRADLTVKGIQIDGDSRVDCYRGTVRIVIPDSLGLSIRTDLGRRGHLESDFEINVSKVDGRNFVGRLNGGGPELFLKIDRGDIILKR